MTDAQKTIEQRSLYETIVNMAAAIILVLLWKGAAWVLAVKAPAWLGLGLSEDHWFTTFVAITLALHLPGRGRLV